MCTQVFFVCLLVFFFFTRPQIDSKLYHSPHYSFDSGSLCEPGAGLWASKLP